MKKSISIFCALTLLFSVFAVCLCTPASAESVKYVEAENFTLPNGTGTNLKVFTFEDFEYEVSDAFETPYISKYVNDNVTYSNSNPHIVSAADLNGKGLYFNANKTGTFPTDKTGTIALNSEYWHSGNKITSISFDAMNIKQSQIAVNFVWAKELDKDGYETGTTTNTACLGAGLALSGSGASSKVTVNHWNGAKFFTQPTANQAWYGDEEDGIDAHYEISVSYSDITETSLKATYSIKIYRFISDGDYSSATPTGTYSNSIDINCSSIEGLTVENLTLMPTIYTNINQNRPTTLDNLKVGSVDAQAIAYVNTYKNVFNGTDNSAESWKAAAADLNELSALVQNRLAAYKTKIDDHYKNAEKIVSDDFDDNFISGMFWSNYDNLIVESGKVTGNKNASVKSVANGLLANDKAISAVYLKGLDNPTNATEFIYPLYTDNNYASFYVYKSGTNNVYRIGQHGGQEVWKNFELSVDSNNKKEYSGDNMIQSTTADIENADVAIYYDWSNYNAAGGYKIRLTYSVKYKIAGSTEYTSGIAYHSYKLTDSTNAPKAEDFKFAMRNIHALDAVTIYSTDNTAGSFDSTGIYLNSTDKTDKNNGDIVFTNINKTNASFGMANVAEFGTLFISKGSLTAAGLTPEELTTETANVIKVSNADGIEANKTYNVRINGTNNSDWAADRIVARTYAIYKIGNQTITVYGEPAIKSNNATIMTAAKNNSIDISNAKSFEDALTKVMAYKYGE